MNAKVSNHAVDRARERISWSKDATERMAAKALERGVKHSDTAGNLRRYMDKLFLSHGTANNLRIYGEHVYVFGGNTLITVLGLPSDLKSAARNARG